jgi:hypothetical protein
VEADIGSIVGVNGRVGIAVRLAGALTVEVLVGAITKKGEAEEQATNKTVSMIIVWRKGCRTMIHPLGGNQFHSSGD